MGMKRKFSSDWEPVVLETSVLAEGTWTYQGKVEYRVRLLRRTWNYTSADIDAIEKAVSESINGDYIDYAISDEGNVFFWEFEIKAVVRLVLTSRLWKPLKPISPLTLDQARFIGIFNG